MRSQGTATLLVGGGRPPRAPGAPVNVPIELNSTYVVGGDLGYGRFGNPAWDAFEEVLGRLEGGRALVFASGMAAVAAALSLVPSGGSVVAPDRGYNGTCSLLRGRGPGPLVVADNTFATPLLRTPLDDGADVVLHSATKYLAGHSDVLLGALVARDETLLARLTEHRTLHGAIPGPAETWLALRGLRTLHLRIERSAQNAAELARRLTGHPGVTRVRYPGFGAIVAIQAGSAGRADAICDAVHVWTHATSLGGVESLLERRRRHAEEPTSVPADLIRLSVGIEDIEDLWVDLDTALRISASE